MWTLRCSFPFVLLTIFVKISTVTCNTLYNSEFRLNGKDACYINGGWSSWSDWGDCIGECGLGGKRMRKRICNNPPPSDKGAPCVGADYEVKVCEITGCSIDDYEKLAQDDPIRRAEMKVVQALHKQLPALIELCFSANCIYPIVKKILGDEAMVYWNAMNCVKYHAGCPIPGGWSHWTTWSHCTAICGKGQRFRSRSCNSPMPSDVELNCDGQAIDTRDCTGINCNKHLFGMWNHWSPWSSCSVPCGSGIKERKRSCMHSQKGDNENQIEETISCEGPVRELNTCEIHNCTVNGHWSSWTVWSACSSKCGVGTRSRNRMCNNPSPAGSGSLCSGSATELRQCFTKPCSVRSHEIAYFTRESNLLYSTTGKVIRMLHIYIRFLPLAPFGVILQRCKNNCENLLDDYVKLSLQNGKIIFSSRISECTLTLAHEDRLEIGQWHVILVLICGTYAILRVDDGYNKYGSFSCIPILQNLDHFMIIGKNFHGQIQELAINFKPIQLRLSKNISQQQTGECPYSNNNVRYNMGNEEEGYAYIRATDSMMAPCPKNTEVWKIVIALKPENLNGIVAIIPGDSVHKYIVLLLEEGRVKLKFREKTVHLTTESTEHVSIGAWLEIAIVMDGLSLYIQVNGDKKNYFSSTPNTLSITCVDNTFLGAIRVETKEKICPECAEMSQMSFILGYLEIDGEQMDLLSLPVLNTMDNRFASHTLSFSGQEFRLSCFYDRSPYEQQVRNRCSGGEYVTWLVMGEVLLPHSKRQWAC